MFRIYTMVVPLHIWGDPRISDRVIIWHYQIEGDQERGRVQRETKQGPRRKDLVRQKDQERGRGQRETKQGLRGKDKKGIL